jgi:hypothetical protein
MWQTSIRQLNIDYPLDDEHMEINYKSEINYL